MEGIDKTTFKKIFRDHWDQFKEAYSRYDGDEYDQVIQNVKGGVKVQRLAGRRKTVTLPRIFCEDAWLFTAADVVKADGFSAERKGSVHRHGAMD